MQRKISALIGAPLLVTTFLGFGSRNVGAADAGKVDIKVETNYDSSGGANQVWEANNVATDGVWPNQRELLGSNTPTVDQSYGGSVDVDIEIGANNTQISLFTSSIACLDLVKVTLTGDIFGTLSTFRDGLFTGSPANLVIDNSTPGTVVLTWTGSGCTSYLAEGGESVFNLTAPVAPTPTTDGAGSEGIPATGSNSGSVALIAVLTLLAGGALVLTTRRRMHHS
ncbi:MAG: LPXTG cell wall anchor domain-containing protein [Actinobacteria bacterium]|uniref:Unannotated protein n=1 Tax=freshwater metagenome TaxID=449393 RepID=A0A6J7PZJ4_9ZZZZ|nr:LPXTG cell wall anchor domain-containing protein [Actinomycetota bacterium]MSW78834.1 LPXTG cell wall anchor domain-containing protein [Actinomycetota bacterium]MSX56202.1 LPXTG cell wall anchor domain-containing protein [Actinomycetota bacterium]MSX93466.1 LPXTG cell wall anchor domain-containing protein [Actinomycetota bacterium]MSZ83778.1 LPXTG cell wall anchor domain-containing protein [Actinomycetota bacterium]